MFNSIYMEKQASPTATPATLFIYITFGLYLTTGEFVLHKYAFNIYVKHHRNIHHLQFDANTKTSI